MSQTIGRETGTDVARKCGVSPAAVRRYLAAEREPSAQFVADFCAVYGVEGTWLLTGRGPMRMRPPTGEQRPPAPQGTDASEPRPAAGPQPPEHFARVAAGEVPWQVAEVAEPGQQVIGPEDYEQLAPAERANWLPIVAVAQCGEAVENAADHPAGWADAFARVAPPPADPLALVVRLAGQSMEPTYRDGDLVVLAPAARPQEGEPAVILMADGRATFKRWRTSFGRWSVQLWADNPDWPPVEVDMGQLRGILSVLRHMPLVARRSADHEDTDT